MSDLDIDGLVRLANETNALAAEATRGPWRTGSGYEQSDRGGSGQV